MSMFSMSNICLGNLLGFNLLILNEALTLQFGLCCMLYKELIVMLSTGSWRAMNFSSKIKYEQKIFLPVLKRIMSDFFFYINILTGKG